MIVDIIDNDLSEATGDRLLYVLSTEDELKELLRLQGSDAQSFIDLLDEVNVFRLQSFWTRLTLIYSPLEVSNKTKPQDPLCRHCERTLRRLCGRAGLLPSPITLGEEEITKASDHPVTGGGFADIYVGWHKGKKVALKALRVYGKDNVKKVQKVRQSYFLLYYDLRYYAEFRLLLCTDPRIQLLYRVSVEKLSSGDALFTRM